MESDYYHFLRKGAQRSGKVEGRSPRGDKSRVGIGYAGTDYLSQGVGAAEPRPTVAELQLQLKQNHP